MKNCGQPFHEEICNHELLEDMKNLARVYCSLGFVIFSRYKKCFYSGVIIVRHFYVKQVFHSKCCRIVLDELALETNHILVNFHFQRDFTNIRLD